MNLQGNPTPLQVLQGRIRSLNAISLDRSLSRDGFCADARAAGEGIAQAKQMTQEHGQRRDNPHAVTKKQVGLGNADNTADMDKPVSTAQAAAIAEAKKAGTDAANTAKTAANNARTAASNAQTAAENAQTAADNAQAAADAAQAAADQAQATADSKTGCFTASVTLKAGDWLYSKQTVTVSGVTENEKQPIFITPDADSLEDYNFYEVKPAEQITDAVTFSCGAVPVSDIAVRVVGFTV